MGVCQNQKIDSLKSLLSGKSKIEYSDILYELAYEYVDIDDELALRYAKEALETAGQIEDSFRIVKAARIKSLIFRRLGELDSSMILSTKILPVARRNNFIDELKSILNGLGSVYVLKGHYDRALQYFFESLELREEDGNKFDISIVLNNIGMVYYKLANFDTALSYFNRSIQLKTEIADT